MGADVGEPRAAFEGAIQQLRRSVAITAIESAPWIETTPMHVLDQPTFLNTVLRCDTELGPHQLLTLLQSIERSFGRNRATERRFGPRPLDLDILLYDDLTIRSDRLIIPHPRMHERPFVLGPLRMLTEPRAADYTP